MICNNNYLADILRVCEIKDLIWVMRFQSPLVYIVFRDKSHYLLTYFFWYLLVLYINSFVICLKFATKWTFSYFQPILAAIFVTIATLKVKSMPDFYTLAIVLIN